MWVPCPFQARRADAFPLEVAALWGAHERKGYIDLDDLKHVQLPVDFMLDIKLIDIEW